MSIKYENLNKIFEDNKNDSDKVKMSQYMQNKFIFYGINAKVRKSLEKDFIKEAKHNKKINWTFLNECYDDPHREMQYFVLDYLTAMQKYLSFSDISKLEYYVKNKQWWDTIDKLDKIIGNISYNDERLDNLMLEWSLSDNIWYRRLSIDHQQNRKNNTNILLLEQIIINNLGSNEFFINKAIGWSLREYSKTNFVWVNDFIKKHYQELNHLSIREASKYLEEK